MPDLSSLTWTFRRKDTPGEAILSVLLPGEQVYACYSTIRDQALLTTKRMIVMDKQGLTGNKIEVYSLPYTSIKMWSSENAGLLDFDAELELWTLIGHIKLRVTPQCDIREFDRILGHAILNSNPSI